MEGKCSGSPAALDEGAEGINDCTWLSRHLVACWCLPLTGSQQTQRPSSLLLQSLEISLSGGEDGAEQSGSGGADGKDSAQGHFPEATASWSPAKCSLYGTQPPWPISKLCLLLGMHV